MTNQDDRQRASAATAALADIERQQFFVTQRLREFAWVPWVVAVVLAVAAASLAYRNVALFFVVQVIYLAALIPLVGVPVRSGVLPREGRQSQIQVFAFVAVLVLVPALAMLGPWWTALVAGAGAAVAVVVLSRWRLATNLHEARRPPLARADQQHVVSDRIASVPAAVVIVVMCAGALASASPYRLLGGVGVLAYSVGAVSLFVRQQRLGVPKGSRAGLFVGVALLIPATLTFTSIFTSLRGNWWVASCCALAAALTVTAIRRGKHDIPGDQAHLASPPDGANE